MHEIIKVNHDTDMPTISARDLHARLCIDTRFNDWFRRMCEYGFSEGKDFYSKMSKTPEPVGRPPADYDLTVDMAKEIAMIQRTPTGKQIREYLINLEKAWNSPEQIMARALKMADATIMQLKGETVEKDKRIEEMRPKEVFADAVTESTDCILVRDLAKLIKQNGYNTGEVRLYRWMRENGYIMKVGTMPTQRAMNMGLFRVKKRTIPQPCGKERIESTTMVTGKGQQYFVNKFIELKGARYEE